MLHPTADSDVTNDEPPLALAVMSHDPSPPSPPTSFDPNNDKPPHHGPTLISYNKHDDTRIAPTTPAGYLTDNDCMSLWCHLVATLNCMAAAMLSSEVTSSILLGTLWDPQLQIKSDDLSNIPLF